MGLPERPDVQSLPEHDRRSDERAHYLASKIDALAPKGSTMSHEDSKVVINNKYEKEGGGMDGLAPMAAIAALGQRNEPGAGLAGIAPFLMGNRGFGSGGEFLGAAVGGFVGSAFGGRRGGFLGGGDGDCGSGGAEARIQTNADTLALLAATNRVGDAVAAAGATSTINLLQQTNEIQQLASANAGLIMAGTAATERSVTNSATVLAGLITNVNQNVLTSELRTQAAIVADGNATRALINQIERDNLLHSRNQFDLDRRDLTSQLARQQTEVNVTQTVTNTARADAQANAVAVALTAIDHRLRCMENGHNQLSTAVSRITQFGTGNVAVPNNSSTNQQG